jgi:hypothetical protein
MLLSSSKAIAEIDQDIAEAERLIHERLQSIMAALRSGGDTAESENRVRRMRAALELLQVQRRNMVRAVFEPQSRSAKAA